MRKDILALGMFVMFLGLVFLCVSRIAIEQQWMMIPGARAEPTDPVERLSIQGDLKEGERFKVTFTLRNFTPYSLELGVVVNVTDPNGYSKLYEIPLSSSGTGTPLLVEPFPEDIANYTGTYKVSAEGYDVTLRSLVLQRKGEPLYPYSFIFPVGIAIFLGGGGISLLAVKMRARAQLSKRKGLRNKRR